MPIRFVDVCCVVVDAKLKTGFHFQNSELSYFNPIQQDFQSLARQYQIYNNDKIINTYFKVRALKNFSENDK